jgi:hypothetical protein
MSHSNGVDFIVCFEHSLIRARTLKPRARDASPSEAGAYPKTR